MAREKTDSRFTKTKPYTIYVIIHPHTKEFFVHYTTTTALRNAMKQHYTLNNIHTKSLFEEHRETIYPPEMYAIEENEMTVAECFIRKIIWIKYFLEKNFIPLNHEDDISSAENLFEENISDYKKIETINVEDIISRTNRRFPHYGRERMERTEEEKSNERKQMKFYCTEEERELIIQNAANRGQTLSAFMRDVSINTISLNFNYDAIIQHLNEINQIKSELNAIITMMIQTKQAYPVEIEKIISLLTELNKTEKIMLQNTSKERQQIRNQIKKILTSNN